MATTFDRATLQHLKDTTITTFDRSALRLISDEVEAAVQAIAERHGLTIKAAGGVYGTNEGSVKLVVKVKQAASGLSADEDTFRKYAQLYGLEPAWFGQTFRSGGRTYTISGISLTSRTRPVIADREGKRFKFDTEDIRRVMAQAVR